MPRPLADLSLDRLRERLIAERRDRLFEQLERAPFDAIVVSGAEAIDYATGFRSVPGQIHADHPAAAVVTPERTRLVLAAADTAPAVDGGADPDDIVPFGRFYFEGDRQIADMSDRHADFADALREALRPLSGRPIGVVGAPAAAAIDTDEATCDASHLLLQIRAVKLPAEQELLWRAAELAENGIQAALSVADAGVTERELAAAVSGAMTAGGGVPRFVVATVGTRTALGDAVPTDRPCVPGDLIRLDVGCQLEGYWSDIARTAVLGEPTAQQARRYSALLDGVQREFDVATAGRTAGEVFAAGVDTVTQGGLSPYRRHHVGHAIGLSVYEHPVVRPDEPTVLTEGMVFCLETPYYEIGWGGMMVEDTGVVTGNGFELFTTIDRTLRVVGR